MEPGMNFYQRELSRLLALSTLAPGTCEPSASDRQSWHAAVYVGDVPLVLCGPHDDHASVEQAQALADSPLASRLFSRFGLEGEVWAGIVHGEDIAWRDREAAIFSKVSGQREEGGGVGTLMAFVLNDERRALASVMCVMTGTAQAIDPECPTLDDGSFLPLLASLSRHPAGDGLKPGF